MRTNLMAALVLGGAVLLAGCDDESFVVPDLNNPGLEELATNPTPDIVREAAVGLLIGSRQGMHGQISFVSHLGILGRESLVFDPSDPRYMDQMVDGTLVNGDGAFGGSLWSNRYANMRLGSVLLGATDIVQGFTAAELEAIRGFTKFIMASDLLRVILTRDANGAVATILPLGEGSAPLVEAPAVYDRIETLLGEAVGHLDSGGEAFPFQLSPGYADFATPAELIEAVHALHARVDVYREDYDGALTHLASSFVSTAADLDLGVYHSFGSQSGDQTNGLFQGSDPQIVAYPTMDDDAEPGDQRAEDKLAPLPSQKTLQGVSSDLRFTIYNSLTTPVPMIRNEELILLRAEARWFTGDLVGAMSDLNFVRTESGGLPPILTIPTSDEAFIDALLYERQFSLLFEGGHRWIDHRRFGRLDELPNPRPGDFVPAAFPIPQSECLAREAGDQCEAPLP
ncbi:MAG: RagB/SusD family nutrient uptake outer membrane protein [Gemmatimonadetes bacterium]|nr:RagB/SusD family nutrient uptake outer membrane protein [Gemmatimonadota bacterium]